MPIDITPEAFENLWEDYLEAARPDGGDNTGGIELYDIEGMNDAAHSMFNSLRALSAALTASQAETAAVIETAIGAVRQADADCNGAYGACENIHALTPADSKAALDRMIAEAEERGMRKAAEIATQKMDPRDSEYAQGWDECAEFICSAILAAIPKGKDHE